ncbi:MAG TPA: hypothetical protein VKD90_22750 [Gemmataceae bacterium]|nr:hypothetical protein [Gemmataceae bacterium]
MTTWLRRKGTGHMGPGAVVRAGFLLTLLAVPGPTAESAPRPKAGDRPGPYFPTAVGDAWVSEVTYGGKVYEFKQVVTAVESKGGVTVVTVRREEDRGSPKSGEYRVSDAGVFLAAYDGKPFDPPKCLLRLPARAGDGWEQEHPPGGFGPGGKSTFRVGKEAEVEVPAGRFRAVSVEQVNEGGEADGRLTHWHAPGRGVVKVEGVLGKLEFRQVLKSFAPGPK